MLEWHRGLNDTCHGREARFSQNLGQLRKISFASPDLVAIRDRSGAGEPKLEWHDGLSGRHHGDNARCQEPPASTGLIRLKKERGKIERGLRFQGLI